MKQVLKRYFLSLAAIYLLVHGMLLCLTVLGFWPQEGVTGYLAALMPGVEAINLRATWGILSVLLGATMAAWAWWVHPERQEVVFKTRHGDLEVSKRAIQALVQSLTDHVEGARAVETSVTDGDDGISLRLGLTVDSEVPVTDVVEQFQMLARSRLEEVFGINQLDTLTVRINNVSNEVVKSFPFDTSSLPEDAQSDDSVSESNKSSK